MEKFLSLNLFQANNLLNYFGRLLDLVLVDDSLEISIRRSEPLIFPEDKYHPTLLISILNLPALNNISTPQSDYRFNFRRLPSRSLIEYRFCFKRADFSKLNSLIFNTDWERLLHSSSSCISSDDMVAIFYHTLSDYFLLSIPLSKVISSDTVAPWSIKELRSLKSLKTRCFKKFKKTGSSSDYARYSILLPCHFIPLYGFALLYLWCWHFAHFGGII